MWQNYMIVSVDVGELAEATRALSRVVEELHEKDGAGAVDVEVLERLVDAVVRADVPEDPESTQGRPNEGKRLFPRVLDLFTRSILPRISDSARIFRAYARLLTWAQQNPSASSTSMSRNATITSLTNPVDPWAQILDAHLNAYKCSVGLDEHVETDVERWKEAVVEVEDFVDILRNLGPRVGESGTNWRFQARGVVRTFMGRTKASFGDEPGWDRLVEMLDELKGSGM